jgi:hypothetical protein
MPRFAVIGVPSSAGAHHAGQELAPAALGAAGLIALGILSFHRRLVRGYEHRLSSSASRVYWAMTDVMARRLTGTSTPSWRFT